MRQVRSKDCLECGTRFYLSARESFLEWVKRQFCSISCARRRQYGDMIARFWANVEVGRSDECWPWKGSMIWSGYGKAWFRGKTVSAHRVAFELAKGPIPKGLTIDHLCSNRPCCNPSDLEAVEIGVNVRRSAIAPAALNARKTHCPRGHPFSGRNLVFVEKGRERRCRSCENAKSREYQRWKRSLSS